MIFFVIRSLKGSETSRFNISIGKMEFTSIMALFILININLNKDNVTFLSLALGGFLYRFKKCFGVCTYASNIQLIHKDYICSQASFTKHFDCIMMYGKNILEIILITLVEFIAILSKIMFLSLSTTSKLV